MVANNRSDTQDLHYVYEWRQEQEQTLRAAKGTGMTQDQVTHFVDGCMLPRLPKKKRRRGKEGILTWPDYPSYELFTETLRQGAFRPSSPDSTEDCKGKQLRLIVNKERRVQDVLLY